MSRHKFAKRFGGANIAVNASTQSLHERGATGVTFIRCNFRLDNVFSDRHSNVPRVSWLYVFSATLFKSRGQETYSSIIDLRRRDVEVTLQLYTFPELG